MKIGCVSDMHGRLARHHIPDGLDVLVIAGDYMPNFPGWGDQNECREQLFWLRDKFIPLLDDVGIPNIVLVAGNHDWLHFKHGDDARQMLSDVGITYLQDEAALVCGLNFYGSPWQPWFHDWAFNFPQLDDLSNYKVARETWNKIPKGTDVLITHGPPHGILDKCPDGRRVGCPILREKVLELTPKLHIFGHIHDCYGKDGVDGFVTFINASLCNEAYKPVNPIQVVEV